METNLILFDDKEKNVFCSLSGESMEDKKKIYNAIQNADLLVNDCINKEILLRDVYCEKNVKNIIDEETGEVTSETKYRTILFDNDGVTYATGSYGIYNTLSRLFKIFGTPESWNEPLKVKIVKIKNKHYK